MGAPMVIKWTDGGAPTLSREASSLIGVLDYCLPQKGWTKVFSGTDKAVFRAGSGVRKFFRVVNDDSFYYISTSYAYCLGRIDAFDAMTDVDTGTGQWEQSYFNVSYTGTPVPRPWMCIFNETTLLFVCLPYKTTGVDMGTANSILLGFGDTVAALPGNTSRSFVAGGGGVLRPVQHMLHCLPPGGWVGLQCQQDQVCPLPGRFPDDGLLYHGQ